MGTFVHAYDPNQNVFVIESCEDDSKVLPGTVIRVRAESTFTLGETILYDIHLVDHGSGTFEFIEGDVFPDKQSALTEYSNRVNDKYGSPQVSERFTVGDVVGPENAVDGNFKLPDTP